MPQIRKPGHREVKSGDRIWILLVLQTLGHRGCHPEVLLKGTGWVSLPNSTIWFHWSCWWDCSVVGLPCSECACRNTLEDWNLCLWHRMGQIKGMECHISRHVWEKYLEHGASLTSSLLPFNFGFLISLFSLTGISHSPRPQENTPPSP